MLRNHSHTMIGLMALAALAAVSLLGTGCNTPEDPAASTKAEVDADAPDYLAGDAEEYDHEMVRDIKNARARRSMAPASSGLTFADVAIPDDLDTIDPETLDTQPTNLANPAVILDLQGGDRIIFELYADKAPATVDHFIAIVESGYYSGQYFHRSDDMCIQGGDAAVSGSEPWPRTVDLEISGVPFDEGAVGMARTQDPNSASAQFFLTKTRSEHLDSGYANFGQVLEGMDVVHAVPERRLEMRGSDVPLDENSRISRATLVRFEGYQEAEEAMLEETEADGDEGAEDPDAGAEAEGDSAADDGHAAEEGHEGHNHGTGDGHEGHDHGSEDDHAGHDHGA